MANLFDEPALAQQGERLAQGIRPCHVAHLHSTLGIYGAERWTLTLAKHLNLRKVQTIVISVGIKPGADAFYNLATSEGLSAFHIRVPGKLNPHAIRQLRRLLLEQAVDVLHTHGFKADVLGYFSTRNLPVRLVSTLHGWSADEGFRIRAYEAISRAFLRRFDRIYPLSPALFEDLQQRKFASSKLHLILNAVDLSAFEYRFRVRRPLDPFSLLFVGRICRPKGIFDLMRAFAQATFNGPAQLTVVGDGPDRQEVVDLSRTLGIANKVTFVGAVPNIAPFLRQSNCLVLPSYAEGIPRTVMEAFAAGVPVIGTAISGIKQLVDHELTGLLVPANDPSTLARALERLCASPIHAEHIAARARERVIESYSAGRMARDYEREYRALCNLQ